MKTLLVFTSVLVLAAGCCSSKKNAGAPPAPIVTTQTGYGAPAVPVTTETVIVSPATGTGYTTESQPGQNPVQGWYVIQPHP